LGAKVFKTKSILSTVGINEEVIREYTKSQAGEEIGQAQLEL